MKRTVYTYVAYSSRTAIKSYALARNKDIDDCSGWYPATDELVVGVVYVDKNRAMVKT